MRVGALVLFARVVARTADFYRAIGMDLSPLPNGRHVGAVDGVRLAIAEGRGGEAPLGQGLPGATMVGFEVASVDEAILAAHSAGGSVLRPIEALSWGRRVVLADPDGRAVEIVDRIKT